MPFTSIVFGVLLIIVGVIGYVHGIMNEKASFTALIPALFGVVIALLGLAAQAKENLRKHLMHAAVLVGLIGFLASAGRLARAAESSESLRDDSLLDSRPFPCLKAPIFTVSHTISKKPALEGQTAFMYGHE